MKWLFLGLLLLALAPVSNWYRTDPKSKKPIAMLMGFLPFVITSWHLYVAPISWAMWPGYVKGLEISALDALALAILLGRKGARAALPFKFVFGLYIVLILLSALESGVPMATTFYAWQVMRMFLVCAAAAALCLDDDAAGNVVSGMAAGVAMQAVAVINERLGGALQAGGSFGHQNLLGMLTHFAVFPAMALVLAGSRRWLPLVGVISGIIIAVLGASRGTIGFAAAGYGLLFLLSILRRPSARKTAVIGAAVVVLALASPFVAWSLNRRFEVAPLSTDYDERAAFAKAARLMIADHPFGVGANQYVVMVNTGNYADRAGIAAIFGSRSATVHNLYLLMAAEISILGAISLVMLLVAPVLVGLRAAWRFRNDGRGDFMLGCAVAIITVGLQSLFEWVFVSFEMQYLFAINAGLIAGLAHAVRTRKGGPAVPRKPQPPELAPE